MICGFPRAADPSEDRDSARSAGPLGFTQALIGVFAMRTRATLFCAALLLGIGACGDGSTDPSPLGARTYLMGFSAIPPRPDPNVVFQNLEMWSLRADAAILHIPVPYTELLAGVSAVTLINRDNRELVNYHRGKGQTVVITLDLTDGLDRAAEAPQLVQLGRSLTEPAVQSVVRQYAVAISRELAPTWLGLAAETNLIRAAAPAALYTAVRQTANAAAADIRAQSATAQLFISVQVEVAWGWASPGSGYVGVRQDIQDFPFISVLGLSSYPYFVYPDPDNVPLEYYSRIGDDTGLPLIVVEGGWTSQTVGTIPSSADKQRRYVVRHARILDQAAALLVVQLTFADFDVSSFPPPVPANLGPFVYLGLVDANLAPKAALTAWDSLFALARH